MNNASGRKSPSDSSRSVLDSSIYSSSSRSQYSRRSDDDAREDLVRRDINILQDIFQHITNTSTRISLSSVHPLTHAIDVDKPPSIRPKGEGKSANYDADSDEDSHNVDWSQYERMNDAERATLLEKAISSLRPERDYSKNRFRKDS